MLFEGFEEEIQNYNDLYTRWKISQIFYKDSSPAPQLSLLSYDPTHIMTRHIQEYVQFQVDKEIARSYGV